MTGWYNGFAPPVRCRHGEAARLLIAIGQLERPAGRCAICGDTQSPLDYHAEDYAQPYRWTPPAVYVVCVGCHRHKLHRRFSRPDLWRVFLAHIRRGGHARELREPEIKRELALYGLSLSRGERASLRPLRPYLLTRGDEWFARLTLDAKSLRDPAAKPR